jgi:hypothetical protein
MGGRNKLQAQALDTQRRLLLYACDPSFAPPTTREEVLATFLSDREMIVRYFIESQSVLLVVLSAVASA